MHERRTTWRITRDLSNWKEGDQARWSWRIKMPHLLSHLFTFFRQKIWSNITAPNILLNFEVKPAELDFSADMMDIRTWQQVPPAVLKVVLPVLSQRPIPTPDEWRRIVDGQSLQFCPTISCSTCKLVRYVAPIAYGDFLSPVTCKHMGLRCGSIVQTTAVHECIKQEDADVPVALSGCPHLLFNNDIPNSYLPHGVVSTTINPPTRTGTIGQYSCPNLFKEPIIRTIEGSRSIRKGKFSKSTTNSSYPTRSFSVYGTDKGESRHIWIKSSHEDRNHGHGS